MKERFSELSGTLEKELRGGETLLCNLFAERSDFVRFNQALVRQAGTVEQSYLTLRLARERRQAEATVALAGNSADEQLAKAAVRSLRDSLQSLPPDPFFLVNEQPKSTSTARRGNLASAEAVVQEVVDAGRGRDLVGFYAGGTIYRGFSSSLGQRNWHEVDTFNFDWSLYRQAEQATPEARDQAVKASYAGFDWDASALRRKMARAADELQRLATPRRTLEPGEYRAYLAPAAMTEIVSMLSWGGFSARARKTKQSPLLLMEAGRTLSPQVTLAELGEGIAAPFQGQGFLKPPRIDLIREGRLGEALVSPRSAKEYGLAPNGAGGGESPDCVEMAPGELPERDVLGELGRGLCISNLWYLNYSDRPAGRLTGMTRFATFWVEGGRIVAPLTPMRFDDSIYRMLGDELVALTRESEMLPDPSTYGQRSTASARLPGALLKSFRFTL